jgi:uncharacterized membrane protein (DUF2068 family)
MTEILRKLAKIELVLIAFSILAAFLTEQYLPQELQDYLSKDLDSMPSSIEFIGIILFLITAIIHIFSLVGLVLVKPWARKYFIITTIIIYPMCLFIGHNVTHSITYAIDQVTVLVEGMILSVLLFERAFNGEIGKHNKKQ